MNLTSCILLIHVLNIFLSRLKFDAHKDLASQRTQDILEQMAEPHQWHLSRYVCMYVHVFVRVCAVDATGVRPDTCVVRTSVRPSVLYLAVL